MTTTDEQSIPGDDVDDLIPQAAVGRGLALAMSSLADLARSAERHVRAASWEDQAAIAGRLDQTASTVGTIANLSTAAAEADFDLVPAGPHVDPATLSPAAAEAAKKATEDVRAAFAAVALAQQSVLTAQLASAEQQDVDKVRARRALRMPRTVSAHGGAMWSAIRGEITYLLHRKPRKVLRAVLIGLLGATGYMIYIRLFDWNTYGKWAPYLAVLFISSVMGTSACFNSMAFDAQRVRVALDRGARMWQILVVKNIALMALVLPLGAAMCVALAIITGRPYTLLASIGLVLCILLLWSGVGNLLSVLLPIRDAPLKVHKKEGTLRQFLIEFAVTWAISYLVLFLLIWRVYSAKGIGERYGSTLLAVVLLVVSALLGWINTTVMAVAISNSPAVHRRLRRELDWAPTAKTPQTPARTPDRPSVIAGPARR